MKKLLVIFSLFALFSCKKEKEETKAPLYPEEQKSAEDLSLEQGEEIFNSKGMCYSCHKPDQKVIGPSIAEIAKIYKEKGASITDFLIEKSEPIVDPSQYNVMKTNFAITKNMSDAELKALEKYMLSFAK